MCTMIVKKVGIDGSGKGTGGWFALNQANVSYDHPFHIPMEHAINIRIGIGMVMHMHKGAIHSQYRVIIRDSAIESATGEVLRLKYRIA